jgi:hypothetical protein
VAEIKTKATTASVAKFIAAQPREETREDCRTLIAMMEKITKAPPKMWGPSIVGFGQYHYKYASGHEGDMCIAGFSPRKQALTIYIMPGFDRYPELMAKLGTYKTGKCCLYVKRLSDIHLPTLRKLVATSVAHVKKAWS